MPTRCATNWARPPPCSTRSTSSNSLPRRWTRSAAASSKTPWATAGTPATRSTPIRNILRAGAHHLTDKQWDRLIDCLQRGDPDGEVLIAWQCYQQVRSAYATTDLAAGKTVAEKIVDTFATCPIPEVARLGRTLRHWKHTYLSYFTTDRSSNGGTEAVNGIIELHRRIARGYRNRENYRLRMLLVAGGLDPTPPPKVR